MRSAKQTPHSRPIQRSRMGRWQMLWIFLLVGIGLLQTLGKVCQSRTLRGLGAVTMASPLPLVFTDVKGVETFASTFRMVLVTTRGKVYRRVLTPRLYARLRGPYNWRNVYGAALAYGPMLPKRVSRSILSHGFFTGGDLARQFGIGETLREVRIATATRTRGRHDRWLVVLHNPALRRSSPKTTTQRNLRVSHH